MPRVLRFRLVLLSLFVVLATCAIGARLYWLQVQSCERFRSRAAGQHEDEFTLPARRGAILDREGRTLAVSLETQSLFAHPWRIDDKEETARRLAPVIGLHRDELLRRLRSEEPFVWLHRFLDGERAAVVRDLGRAHGDEPAALALGSGQPFGFETETKRFYPRGALAAHAVGFATIDGVGIEGAEHEFHGQLQGDPTVWVARKDGQAGRLRQLVRAPERESSDVLLTLDLALQHIVERELDRAMRETRAAAASAVLLDPRNGQVLALANRPVIDRSRNACTNGEARKNRVLETQYEPGSTFKIVPMALLLEHGKVRRGERIYCHDGQFVTSGRVIRDVGKNGVLTPPQIVSRSSNIGMVLLTRRLDSATLYRGILDFGFDTPTGIELPGEITGQLHPVEKWSGYTHDSLAFGQEIAVTPLQMAAAMATIANDGVRVPPRIGLATRDDEGKLHRFQAPRARRVVSVETARTLRSMLEAVVDGGTGRGARIHGYRVAGKSGTAQKAEENGGYSDTAYVASFVGFAPAGEPRLVALVLLDSPGGERHQGGRVAAPIFGRILAESLHYLRVPRDAEPPLAARSVQVVRQRKTVSSGDAAARGTPGRVPDVRRRTLREAVATLAAHGYRVRVQGSGVVLSQSPAPETALAPGGLCTVRAGEPPRAEGTGKVRSSG